MSRCARRFRRRTARQSPLFARPTKSSYGLRTSATCRQPSERRASGNWRLRNTTDHSTSPGATLTRVLPTDLAETVRQFSQRAGVTPFMTLLAAFQALLHRWSGQNDILVGTPIANRNRVETEGLIGFLVNTLVLRADLS